jgi:hypothetical protein
MSPSTVAATLDADPATASEDDDTDYGIAPSLAVAATSEADLVMAG